MSALAEQISLNLREVRERIGEAAQRSGRDPHQITLVAVTKYVSDEATAAILDAGCHALGESRPQDLWRKSALFAAHSMEGTPATGDPITGGPIASRSIDWHLIGHLQRNKVRRTLPVVRLIQSVDSARLLTALNDEAALQGRACQVLLEVNISGDAAKTGLPPAELETVLAAARQWPHVTIRGLMGMAGLDSGPDGARRDFAQLRQLRDRLATQFGPDLTLGELSMGMSGDFEAAIEEGATIVRVGSALFEGIPS